MLNLGFRYVITCLFFFVCMVCVAQSPGGYATGLQFWVKSSAGTFSNAGTNACTNNTALQQWNDQSGNAYNASQATSGLRPTYLNTGSNGNPVIRFANTHCIDVSSTVNIAGSSDYSGFFVLKLSSTNSGGATDGAGDYILDRTSGTNELFSMKVVASGGTNRFFFQKRNNSGGNLGGATSTTVIDNTGFQIVQMSRINNSGGNTLSRIYVNGVLEATQSNATETTNPPQMRIGRHATNASGGMTGDLTELIMYANEPSTANRQKVESYLSIKYGISLNQSTLRDYYDAAGTVIYPATTTHSAYVTTITGIGQDNTSGLNQSNSKNQSTNDFVRMENPSALSNGDYLMWGSNNGTMITPNTADVDGSTIIRRLSRVWRVAHTNTIGSVLVTIDLSSVPGLKNQSDLRLLIDRDGDGFFDNDVAPQTGTLTGSNFSVAGVSFQNGDYFTIGSTNAGNTPLPIELSEFKVKCTSEGGAVLNWKTESEIESEYFSIERSGSDLVFSEYAQIKAAGTSYKQHSYSFIDSIKITEETYYQLKQVDTDGSIKRYGPLEINCTSTNAIFKIYPNPGSGHYFIKQTGYSGLVTICDAIGNKLMNVVLEKEITKIDLSHLPNGLYFLLWNDGSSQKTEIITKF